MEINIDKGIDILRQTNMGINIDIDRNIGTDIDTGIDIGIDFFSFVLDIFGVWVFSGLAFFLGPARRHFRKIATFEIYLRTQFLHDNFQGP